MNYDDLFETIYPALYRYCRGLTRDADAADDAAQEAFVRLYREKPVGPDRALRVWLFRVATNVIRDRARVDSNRRRLLERYPQDAGPGSHVAVDAVRMEAVSEVGRVLGTLSERDGQLLLMREEGFSYREIAGAVGVNESSIGTLLVRAEQRFVEAWERLSQTDWQEDGL